MSNPVAWQLGDGGASYISNYAKTHNDPLGFVRDYTIPLYASPVPASPPELQAQEPLSEEQILADLQHNRHHADYRHFFISGVRYAERAHGIGGKLAGIGTKRQDTLTEADFQPVYCVPDGVGKFAHYDKRVPMADQEVLYRSLRYMPSELAQAEARAKELAAGIGTKEAT